MKQRVVIVGAGFAGLNCAKRLKNKPGLDVVVIDKRNHHLFQPLLYQVATAGLSPADIAVPIRGLLSGYRNTRVVQATVDRIDLRPPRSGEGDGAHPGEDGPSGDGDGKSRGDGGGRGKTRGGGSADPCSNQTPADLDERARGVVYAGKLAFPFDYLVLAAGAQHAYFGHEEWEPHAPGLKTLEQATEIRRRVLDAFEAAEIATDPAERRAALTFVVVGGGPTGVELAGAIGEMSRFTLSKDFRCIDPKATRIILVEAGTRILQSFPPELSEKAMATLERVGVQVWTESPVTGVDAEGVTVGEERIQARTVLWAAGVRASDTGATLGVPLDSAGRVLVGPDLTIPGHPNVFVLGDQAHAPGPNGKPLPGVATVALQQGRYVARTIQRDLKGRPREAFEYWDKGQMATIGRRRAVLETRSLRMAGFWAWIVWLLVHIYYLTGFKNRLLVLLQWSWSYMTFARGARLIVEKGWRSYGQAAAGARAERRRSEQPPPEHPSPRPPPRPHAP